MKERYNWLPVELQVTNLAFVSWKFDFETIWIKSHIWLWNYMDKKPLSCWFLPLFKSLISLNLFHSLSNTRFYLLSRTKNLMFILILFVLTFYRLCGSEPSFYEIILQFCVRQIFVVFGCLPIYDGSRWLCRTKQKIYNLCFQRISHDLMASTRFSPKI